MRTCPCVSHGKKGQGRESAGQLPSKVQDCGNWGDLEVLKALVATTQPLLPEEKESTVVTRNSMVLKALILGRPGSPQDLKVPAASNCVRLEFSKQI